MCILHDFLQNTNETYQTKEEKSDVEQENDHGFAHLPQVSGNRATQEAMRVHDTKCISSLAKVLYLGRIE